MLSKYILSESVYDYKYKSILEGIDFFKVVEGGFFNLLIFMILHQKKCVYHIRYIKYNGLIRSTIRLLVIVMIVKLSRNKMIWSCHNIDEHNISNEKHNKLIRTVLLYFSDGVVVFHYQIKNKLPVKYHYKIKVANFGSFKKFVENNKEIKNPDFTSKFNLWKESNQIDFIDIISVSTAKKSRLDVLVNGTVNSCYKSLIIAPGVKLEPFTSTNNVFIYNDSSVYKEVYELLSSKNQVIGFVGHCNYSVATSLFMFASFYKPIICFNVEPINTIVKEHGLGVVIDSPESIDLACNDIKCNYSVYSENVKRFMLSNSWSKSKLIHEKLLKSIF